MTFHAALLLAGLVIVSAVQNVDERLSKVSAKISAERPADDATDKVVSEYTGGKFSGCAQVKKDGFCQHPTAQKGCAKTCAGTVSKMHTVVTADKPSASDTEHAEQSVAESLGIPTATIPDSCKPIMESSWFGFAAGTTANLVDACVSNDQSQMDQAFHAMWCTYALAHTSLWDEAMKCCLEIWSEYAPWEGTNFPCGCP
jgi:hypothetical protein